MSTASSTNQGPWFGISMGLIGLIVGYVLATGFQLPSSVAVNTPPTGTAPTPTPTAPAPTPTYDPATADDDMVLGKADAPVTLIEFSDMQCPFCRKFWREAYQDIKKEYVDTGKVKIVFRDYPLSFHPAAMPSALALECVQDQSNDLAWRYHDVMFTEQDKQGQNTVQYGETELKEWARQLPGLNLGTFDECLASKKHAAEIQKDMTDAQASGVDATPGFWILGPDDQSQQLSGAYPFATFKTAIDGMLD